MGIFNFLKKGKKVEQKKNSQIKSRHEMTKHKKGSKFTMNNITTEGENKYIRLDYFDAEAEFPSVYNSTRLVVKDDPKILQSKNKVYEASVSWYNEGKDNYNMYNLYDIYLGLDLEKIVIDEKYQKVLMTELLQQKRIMEYIKKDKHDDYASCYIGEVQPIKKYNKYGDFIGTEYKIIFNERDNNEIENVLRNSNRYDIKTKKELLNTLKKFNERESR